jgi:hypothetical protein
MSNYPEHDKLTAISDQSQAIGEFLEWLPSQGRFIGAWRTVVDCPGGGIWEKWSCIGGVKVNDRTGEEGDECPVCDGRGVVDAAEPIPEVAYVDINKILAEFFDIDLNKLEAEKRAMLDEIRAANA